MVTTLNNPHLPSSPERHKLLVEWNATASDYPRDLCIHQLFEQEAARRPQAIAVRFGDEQMSYQELNRRANQMAHRLRELGVGPETLVSTLVERSLEMAVALLGILKAGGAFVPLDVSYPAPRLAFMAADTQSPVVVAEEAVLQRLADRTWLPVRVVTLDSGAADIGRQSCENPENLTHAGSLAYVMYTSGSTGTPKGVMVPHRAVVRLVKNTNYLHFGEDEVFLQFSPISFDASTLEIWGALLNGGCLAVAAPGSQSLEAIGAAIARHGVTTAWLTSGLFNLMIEQRPQDLRPLRQLLAGGDALSVVHVRKALENLPHCRLVNGYGPTEGTTFTCCHTIRHEDAQATAIPLGRPIANTQVYVLDENREPVAIREAGELCVGGDGLARGYLHQPELTAERFIANPFSNDPTSKLYRTGDRVRYRGDGTIEFLGRIDDQVKISGYRVEPGEIESVMRQHPEVKDAAVVARQNGAGAKKLLAYVVPRNGHYSAQQLQAYLEQKLPAYMLPSALVRMDALPLSPNGKLDRNALPELGEGSQPLQETARPGRSELEEQIAGVWQKVLGLKEVNLDDNFFDLGGDSLQLLEAHAQLQAGISPEIQVADLFEYSTIRALAHKLAGKAKKDFRAAQRRADQQQAAWARLKENRNQGAR